MLYLLDTNILIDHLRGISYIAEFLYKAVDNDIELCICDIVVSELVAGMRKSEKDATFALMESFHYIPTTYQVACTAGEIKQKLLQKGQAATLADAMIAAIALEHSATLITNNQKHFKQIPKLRMLVP